MTLLLWSAVTGPSQWWRGGWAEPAGCCHGGFLDVVTRGEFGPDVRGWGPGSLSAAAAAWDELAAELWLAAASFESVCSGLADRWWQGPSSRMMAAQAARHTGWLAAAATQAEGAASQAQTMALAYEAAFAATVHPALVAANRALVAWLAGSNVFGQNTPAIAAAEAIYEQMWAQDVVAMLNYHAVASAVGARLRPWQQLLHELPRRLGGEHPTAQTRNSLTRVQRRHALPSPAHLRCMQRRYCRSSEGYWRRVMPS